MASRPVYRAHVVARRCQVLRSDGLWHEALVSEYDAKASGGDAKGGMHLVHFLAADGSARRGDWYDLNHPLRQVRWYDDAPPDGAAAAATAAASPGAAALGPLLHEHVLPASVAANSTQRLF